MSWPEMEARPPWMVGGKQSRKDPYKQPVNSNLEHLHMSAGTGENARDMAPASACVT